MDKLLGLLYGGPQHTSTGSVVFENIPTNPKAISSKSDLELVDYYIDDGYSGTNFNRPGFERLLEEFIKKELNITEIIRLNIDNNIKYIYIGKDKEIKLDYK